ncbi:hypothetical protein HDU76_010413, partial [Blyttiomyces sp. JEL0837]
MQKRSTVDTSRITPEPMKSLLRKFNIPFNKQNLEVSTQVIKAETQFKNNDRRESANTQKTSTLPTRIPLQQAMPSSEFKFPSPADMEFLWKVEKDLCWKEEGIETPKIDRMYAAFVLGYYRAAGSNKVGAIEMFRPVMDTDRFMTKAERKAKIFLHLGWDTVQYAIDELMKQLKVILKTLEIDMSEVVGPLSVGELEAAAEVGGSSIDENDRVGKVSITKFGKLVEEILGRVCGVCKKKRRKGYEGDPGVSLIACSRCKMVYYCSVECQTIGWKAGHKQKCRKQFEFKEKDLVALKDLSAESLNGRVERLWEWRLRMTVLM